ncbi:FAD-dependent oxidoreductase [Patescibacteria group bacterium]
MKLLTESSWWVLWEPLYFKKFGKYADEISAAWFWARIKKRSTSLGYPEGGYIAFSESIQKKAEGYGVNFIFNSKVSKMYRTNNKIKVATDKSEEVFDKVICTVPNHIFSEITQGLTDSYLKQLQGSKSLGAVNMVLSLNKKLLTDNTYWMNANDMDIPFLAVVEHTNFIDKGNYNNENIVYVGNYLDKKDKLYEMTDSKLYELYEPLIKRINDKFDKSWVNRFFVFRTPFAQPVVTVNYSKKILPFETPVKDVYLCNMQQVYPWDRGTNYAVEMGEKVARLIMENK